jgi:hypothetical protein
MSKPDPSLLNDVVAPKVLDAMRTASDAAARAGVRHGIDVAACRAYLETNAPQLLPRLEDLIRRAEVESVR